MRTPGPSSHLTHDQVASFVEYEASEGRAAAARRFPSWSAHLILCDACVSDLAACRRAVGLEATVTAPRPVSQARLAQLAAQLARVPAPPRPAVASGPGRPWVERIRTQAREFGQWVAHGLEDLEGTLFGRRRQLAFRMKEVGAEESDEAALAEAVRATRPLGSRSEEDGWQMAVMAAPAAPGEAPGTRVLLTPSGERFDDPESVFEGWQVEIVVGGERYGPRQTNSAGIAEFESLPFDAERLRLAEVTISAE